MDSVDIQLFTSTLQNRQRDNQLNRSHTFAKDTCPMSQGMIARGNRARNQRNRAGQAEFPYATPIALIRFSPLEVIISALFIISAVAIVFVYTYYGYEEIVKVSSGAQANDKKDNGSTLFITYCYLTPTAIIIVVLVLLAKTKVMSTPRDVVIINSSVSMDDTVVEEILPVNEKDSGDADAKEQARIV